MIILGGLNDERGLKSESCTQTQTLKVAGLEKFFPEATVSGTEPKSVNSGDCDFRAFSVPHKYIPFTIFKLEEYCLHN